MMVIPSARWAQTVIMTVSKNGLQRDVFCLTLKSVPMWLAIEVHRREMAARDAR